MRTYVAASAAVLLILITGCTRESTEDTRGTQAANLEKARTALQNTTREYAEALKSKDFGKIQSFYAPDVSIYGPGVAPVEGLQAVQRLQQSDTTDHSKDVFEISSNKMEVAMAGDIAYTTGAYKLSHADGRATDSGRFVAIWRMQDGGNWALAEDVFIPDTVSNPAPLTPQ
jgi:ketosteroid isomerase-like protein